MSLLNKNNYLPLPCTVKSVREEAPGLKTFKLEFARPRDGEGFAFIPGQFVEVGLAGFGEAPFSISSGPTQQSSSFEITVRKVGSLTEKMFELPEGSEVGVRGPFGNGYPMNALKGKDLILAAGGCGAASIRSVLLYALAEENRGLYGKIFFYYGARSPKDFIYEKDFEEWKQAGVELRLAVDAECKGWNGCVGFLSQLLAKEPPKTRNGAALLCGPPKMIETSAKELVGLGLSEEKIFVSLERLMHCGIGKCGHCMVSGSYVCADGPVYSLAQARRLLD